MLKKFNIIIYLQYASRRQRGAVLMLMLVIIIMGSAAFLLSALSRSGQKIERDKITADALAQAKDALIGYASSVTLSSSASVRPGDLPCPDLNNDGASDSPCGSAAGSNQAQRLGRLPWKTLGLSDLRDSSGERLWYAVSNNFKEHWNTALLNSNTAGTISVRAPDGSLLHDGSSSSGAVAIIIAPGGALQRTDQSIPQDRSSPGANAPKNYLDIANGEDNAGFTDGASDGFIQGRVKDAGNKVIVNDQILVITQNNIMQSIQKRVAGEVKKCLDLYALNNNGRYPWAAPITDLGSTYNDKKYEYFGRIPDDLGNTDDDIHTGSSGKWNACSTHMIVTPAPWWKNWKELVFYSLAKEFRPDDFVAPGFPSTCATAANCLSINNASTPARYVVIVAGKTLVSPDQTQRKFNRSDAYYYLEGGNESANQSGSYTFMQSAPLATYNDTLVYQ